MLEVKNVNHCYGKKKVLDKVNISFGHGIYGLLGINGAGKTTLINILTGILNPDSGNVYYNGMNINTRKSNFYNYMGFMPQYTTFYPEFTALEFLEYMCVIKGIPRQEHKKRVMDLLEQVNLVEDAKKKLKAYSGGMRQRIGIAQALLNQPEILILDEPTAGLDPLERIRFRNLISNVASNRTVIFATHIVQDIEYIANQVILLHRGRVVAQGAPKEIVCGMRGGVYVLSVEEKNLAHYLEKYVVCNSYHEGDRYCLRVLSLDEPVPEAERMVPGLEDVFLFYTQRSDAVDSVN